MVKITLKNPGELDALLSAADYEKFVAEEGGTLSAIDRCNGNPRNCIGNRVILGTAEPDGCHNRTDLELHLINFLCAIYRNLLPTAKPC